VDERPRVLCEVFDEYAHESAGTEESADVGGVSGNGPIADFLDFGVVYYAAFVGALVSDDDNGGSAKLGFVSVKRSAYVSEAL
jgi:hypothetical protein